MLSADEKNKFEKENIIKLDKNPIAENKPVEKRKVHFIEVFHSSSNKVEIKSFDSNEVEEGFDYNELETTYDEGFISKHESKNFQILINFQI